MGWCVTASRNGSLGLMQMLVEWLAQVLFEDEALIAVNKPPGVTTAPKHRFLVRRSDDFSRFTHAISVEKTETVVC